MFYHDFKNEYLINLVNLIKFFTEAKKLKESVIIEKMQDQVQMMLLHHEKYRHSDNPTR